MTRSLNLRKSGIRLVSILFIIGIIVFFILLDHSYRHSGILAQETDFKSAFENIAKSHESIIIMITIATGGIVIGYYLSKKPA